MKDTFVQLSATEPVRLVTSSQTEPCVISEVLATHIEVGWQKLKQRRNITENATLLRVLESTNKTVSVVPDIKYRDVVGVRHKPHVEPSPFAALTVMAVVTTADNHVVLQKRDSGDWLASYENVGWFVRASQQTSTLDTTISERVTQEMGDQPAVVSLLGIYKAHSIAECMYVYLAKLPSSKEPLSKTGDVVCVHVSDLESFLRHPPETVELHPPSKKVLEFLLPHINNI